MTEQTETWTTPGGHAVRMTYRDDTSDWNTVSAILTHDEYGLPKGRSGLFVDVGAHIGAWAIGAAIDNPDAVVYAIEPLPENAALIRRNAAQNDLVVVVLEQAAGDNGRVRYGATGTDFERGHEFIGGAVWQEDPSARIVTVPTLDLAMLTDERDIEMLKIDCEGCEWSFLDSPNIARVAEISGEYHPRGLGPFPARVRALLGATHDVTLDDSLDFGAFRAVRRDRV